MSIIGLLRAKNWSCREKWGGLKAVVEKMCLQFLKK